MSGTGRSIEDACLRQQIGSRADRADRGPGPPGFPDPLEQGRVLLQHLQSEKRRARPAGHEKNIIRTELDLLIGHQVRESQIAHDWNRSSESTDFNPIGATK